MPTGKGYSKTMYTGRGDQKKVNSFSGGRKTATKQKAQSFSGGNRKTHNPGWDRGGY